MRVSPSNSRSPLHVTANERLKARSRNAFWGGLIAATLVHFLVFAFFPAMSVAEIDAAAEEPTHIISPPSVEVPEPPAPLRAPAVPVPTRLTVDVPMPKTTFEANPPAVLPPPVPAADTDDFRWITPLMTPPALTNPEEVRAALERSYPPLLRDSGIGGSVLLHVWMDELGGIVQAKVFESSGRGALDEAALEVVHMMEFRPALQGDRPLRVIVALPVEFEVR